MAPMFSNNQQSYSYCNPNQPLSSSFFPFMDESKTLILQQQKKKPRLASSGDESFNPNQSLASSIPPFFEEHETLISRQITKKPRLTSWGCSDGSFNKFGDIRYNHNQSLASSSIPPFFHEHQTLISQQNTKKPRLELPWWSVDKSLDQLSVIFNKPPPITSNSTAGVLKSPPITSNSTAGVLKPPLITSNSTAGVLKPHPDVIVIDDEDEIEEEIPELSDLIFDNTPPISSPSSSTVSKSRLGVILIDDDEEEEIVAVLNDNNQKLDSNGKESSSVNDNEEKNSGDGGFGHVSVDDLGVTIEDLKNIPWEAFDSNWEIKSAIMDPWLGPYIQQLTD